MDIRFLKKIGFSDKEAQLYLSLLRLGPSSVRRLAEVSGLNRGTAYDLLKSLQEKGVVSFYDKESKQHFVAENPEKLFTVLKQQAEDLQQADQELGKLVPELQALYHKGGERPIARYFGKKDLNLVLEDVLSTCAESEEKLYRIYSAEGLRHYLYTGFPSFSDARVGKGVRVKVIALGDGGELRGLDERKWLPTAEHTPTYIIIYPGKVASISLNAQGDPVAVVVENDGVYETQKEIFEALWGRL